MKQNIQIVTRKNYFFDHRSAVLAALIVGCYFRVFFINYGLPYILHSDELTNFNVIQNMLSDNSWNPHFFRYPSLLFYLNLPGEYLVFGLTGDLEPAVKQSLGNGFAPQPGGILAARFLSLVFGCSLIVLGYLFAKTSGFGPVVGLVTAWLIALDPLLVRHSTLLAPDIIATGFATASLACATIICRSDRLRWYIAAGVFAGLAASTKYNIGLVCVAIPVAHIVRAGVSASGMWRIIPAALAAILALFVTSPFLLLDFKNALEGLLFEINHYRSGHVGAEGESFRTNLRWLGNQTGWAAFLVSGCFFTKSKIRFLLPTFVFVILYFALLSAQNVRFERNLLVILPPIFLMIAAGTSAIVKLVATRHVWQMALTVLLLGIAWQGQIFKTAHNIFSYSQDPRREARLWLENQIEDIATVGLDAYSPHLKEKSRTIVGDVFILSRPGTILLDLDYVVVTRAGSGRFLSDPNSSQNQLFSELAEQSCSTRQYPQPPSQAVLTLFKMNCHSDNEDKAE